MAKRFTLTFACLLVLAFSHSAMAIKCYECQKCNDPFQKQGVTTGTCDGFCIKAKAKSDNSPLGVKKGDVVRGCLTLKVQPGKCEESEVKGIKGEVCSCNSDLCNGSDVTKVSIATTIMTTVVAFILILT